MKVLVILMGMFSQSVIGINANKIQSMKDAITAYVVGVQDVIKQVEDKEATLGFKGEYAKAVSNYVTNFKLVCNKIVEGLTSFCDRLDAIKAAFENSDTSLSSSLDSSSSSLLSKFNVDEVSTSSVTGGSAAAMAAGVSPEPSVPSNATSTPAPASPVVSTPAASPEDVNSSSSQSSSPSSTEAQAIEPNESSSANPNDNAASTPAPASSVASTPAASPENVDSSSSQSSSPSSTEAQAIEPNESSSANPNDNAASTPVPEAEVSTQSVTPEQEEASPSSPETDSETSNEASASEADVSPSPESASPAKSGDSMDIPSGNTSYKSYTSYRKVREDTPQGAIVYGETAPYGKYQGTTYNTRTDTETGVRYVTFKGDDTKYYCAAMGTYYGEVGDTFKVTTDEGNTYHVIMCDAKGSDAQGTHEGGTWYHSSGGNKCLTEFYIDKNYIPDEMKVYSGGEYIGTTGTYDSVDQFSGNIVSIEKLS